MLRTHRRKAVLTSAALMAAASLLTACQGSADAAAPASSGDSHSSAPAKDASADRTPADRTPAAGGSQDSTPQAGGVNGTWSGTVRYLAPGKFTVKEGDKPAQAFWVSTKTDIGGTGVICGDGKGQAATPCTEAQLEAAAKKGLSAKVTLVKGIATSVVDNNPATGSGPDKPAPHHYLSGVLGYLAPGKYTVAPSDGPRKEFLTSTTTKINGNGWICGGAGDKPNKPCTEAQLEAAAKKGGVRVVVDVRHGIAVTVDEEHN